MLKISGHYVSPLDVVILLDFEKVAAFKLK